jgi:prepilin-type N-terminal cleavage/methylation domain-containing protein
MKTLTNYTNSKKHEGFTLVELMIATTVFSTILLLATTGVINIGKLYYKGIITARTQETARSVIDEVARSVQLTQGEIKSSSGGPSGYSATCIGKDRYTYRIDTKVEPGGHGLWLDEITQGDECVPSNFSTGLAANSGRELLGTNMRLLEFGISDDASDRTRVNVDVSVAYGDSDLLTHCSPDDSENPGPCGGNPANAQCRSTNSGGSFCAVSSLETFVKRRFSIVYLN